MGTNNIHPVVQVRKDGEWRTYEWPWDETHGLWSVPNEQMTDVQKAYLGQFTGAMGWFWDFTLPYLKGLAADPKDVRIVMGFDS